MISKLKRLHSDRATLMQAINERPITKDPLMKLKAILCVLFGWWQTDISVAPAWYDYEGRDDWEEVASVYSHVGDKEGSWKSLYVAKDPSTWEVVEDGNGYFVLGTRTI